MICQKLKELCEATAKYQSRISQADLVRFACQACQRLDVCPALSIDEFDARALHQIQPQQKKSAKKNTRQ